MDMETFVREKLKDFYKKYKYHQDNIQLCPFAFNDGGAWPHECCAFLFPKWADKYYYADINERDGCPCVRMSKRYIRRKVRAFVKKK